MTEGENVSTWQKVKIGDFLYEREGKYKPNAKEVEGLSRIEKIDFKGNFHIGVKPSKTNLILVKKGDLVISGINVAKGAMGIYMGEEDVVATIHYSSYTFDKTKINLEYFKRFLKSPEFIRLLNEQVKGGIKTEIKPKHILPLEISLPDIVTQNEIISNFEKIENDIAELDYDVRHQQNLLKQLKQTILQEAIEGRLTSKWREQNLDVEPASILLEKIQAEKEKLIKDKKIKKQKPLPPIAEDEKPFEIPESWEWCRFNYIIYENPKNGYSPKPVSYTTKVKTLKLSAITNGFFDKTQFKYIGEQIPKESHLWLRKGDILIQRSNSLEYVGMAAIYDINETNCIYPDLIMKSRIVDGILLPFIHKYLITSSSRNYFIVSATGSQKSMPKINQNIVNNLLVALPPLKEQKEIVSIIEKLFAICDQLEEQINSSKENVDMLMKTVLKEVFEHGEG